jgi:phosphatidylserine/phosphatidylglycerophosphate/cardiolipin synthase-like enzyme
MKIPKIGCIIVCIGLWAPAAFSSQVFFSPNGGVRAQIVGLIQKTTCNVDIAMYSFTSKELGLAISSAAQSGRVVRVLADRDQNKSKSSVISWVSKYVEVRMLPEPGVRGIMHHKFMVLGDKVLVTGSYNWTNNAELFNQENLLILPDPELIKRYHQEFEKLWAKARPYKRGNHDPTD